MASFKIYFTADQHFNHFNCIGYSKRKYTTVSEMNLDIINKFNKVVKQNDVVYFVGDVGFTKELKTIIPQLNGKLKILIKGNHDKFGDQFYYNCGFDLVLTKVFIRVGKQLIKIQHIPTRSIMDVIKLSWIYFKAAVKCKRKRTHLLQRILKEIKYLSLFNMGETIYTICGHVHNAWHIKGNNINIGVDVNNMTPVSLDIVINYINNIRNSNNKVKNK